ncbi:urease accessory protein UreD [Pontibaca salina]|uniref:Urease accessory protein UreD n=1 Tax=Pontibaca salina TaxID=2795731 RepID=A0A934HN09_9RHOB|nr:urease accessory protein UreD [Pontibaca salina]MBI6629956.1 urease accessory protein UreD [Pontibaca salina]
MDDGPSQDMATVYIQSSSGGLYTEDELITEVTARPKTLVHLTTQASTIVHGASRGPSCQSTDLKVEEGAFLEFTPEPVILFPNAQLKSKLRLEIAESASAIIFDSFLAHDYAGGSDVFEMYENDLSAFRPNGVPMIIDRVKFSGKDFATGLTGKMSAYACHGNFFAIAPEADIEKLINDCRRGLEDTRDSLVGVSVLPDGRGISARILSRNAIGLRAALIRLWEVSRLAITGSPPNPRKK